MSTDGPVGISVILPVRNGEPFLRIQLQALERQECVTPWEVIVVDNGSTDGTVATASEFETRLPGFQLLEEETPGKSRALNRGVAAARGRHLIFVDSDDEMGEGYLQKMSEALEEFDVVGSYLDTKTLNPPDARADMVTNDGIPTYHDFRPALPGCIVAMRATVCDLVGPYDVTLMSAEDVDYSWRAYALGATFGRRLDAVMHVRRPPNSMAAFRKSRGYARSAVWLYERYRSEGMRRRTLRNVIGMWRWTLADAFRNGGPWLWGIAWNAGTVYGRAEESIRRRVYFP
ncbi:MAG TPA: glycosyltransferase family A protein [Acidimicrobiales bacterium]|jgi:glycosyltransferase involved in cell wall biosynthesis|nr:glycosyltransferase family A protein [Acidimicrobiales bacterium]